MADFLMPALGADMEHGKVVEWLVKPGDFVHRGDLMAEVDTDKAVMDVESFEDGVVGELLVEVGTTVPVGAPLARIVQTPAVGAERGQPAPAQVQAARPPVAAPAPAAAAPPSPVRAPVPAATAPPSPVGTPGTPAAASARPPAEPGPVSPPVRHLALTLGVDTGTLHGTGRHGAVTRADVEKAARAAAPPSPAPPAVAPQTIGPPPAGSAPPVPGSARGERVPSSPRARRLAADLGVDLMSVAGTGPRGAVTEADVRRAQPVTRAPNAGVEPSERPERAEYPERAEGVAAGAAGTVPAGTVPPITVPPPTTPPGSKRAEPAGGAERAASLRRAIGTLMARSKQTIPHYYLGSTLDLTRVRRWLDQANADRPVSGRLVPAVLLLKATARAAKATPEVNGFYIDGEYRPSAAVHLGVAVALRRGGLVAPAIHDADTLGLDEFSATLRDLVSRARNGRLQRAEMADPTITVTNLGDLGVESVFGVIYPPQVALVGFGRMRDEPYAHDGMLGVRPAVSATLSADHRVSDGLRGGRFLELINELLQEPETL